MQGKENEIWIFESTSTHSVHVDRIIDRQDEKSFKLEYSIEKKLRMMDVWSKMCSRERSSSRVLCST